MGSTRHFTGGSMLGMFSLGIVVLSVGGWGSLLGKAKGVIKGSRESGICRGPGVQDQVPKKCHRGKTVPQSPLVKKPRTWWFAPGTCDEPTCPLLVSNVCNSGPL